MPNRHILALATYVALLPLVYFIPPWVIEHISPDPLISILVTLAMIVPVISYAVMPLFTKAYGDLHKRAH